MFDSIQSHHMYGYQRCMIVYHTFELFSTARTAPSVRLLYREWGGIWLRVTKGEEEIVHEFVHCCWCCFHIISHNQVRGYRTGSSHSGAEEYPSKKTGLFTGDEISRVGSGRVKRFSISRVGPGNDPRGTVHSRVKPS